jgi:hypothetical protein
MAADVGGPSWLAGILAAVMLAVAGYCVARLVSAWRWRRPTELDSDGVHAVMGVAMAGMLVAGLRFVPAGAWAAVFGAAALWFGGQLVRARRGAVASSWRCPHPLPHVVESGAMLFMLLALRAGAPSSGGAMAGMGTAGTTSHFSLLALVLALFTFGYVMWLGDRLTMTAATSPGVLSLPAASSPSGVPPLSGVPALPGAPSQAVALAPRSAACCKIAMGVTMGYMLILML